MNYLLYGDNDFSRDEALTSMKEEIESADLRDVNTTVVDGPDVSFEELVHVCDSVPFLAGRRLVVVNGLLSLFERRPPSKSRQGGDPERAQSLGQWKALAEYLPRAPQTTDIVFVDGRLSASNALFAAIRKDVTARTFPMPNPAGLREWVRNRAEAEGIEIDHRAVDTLAATIGGDLRVMATELEKLSLYRGGDVVRHEDVEQLVSYTKEANIFAAVNAMLEGRTEAAIRLVHGLLQEGRPAPYLLAMIARQVRLLIVAKGLKAQKVPAAEHGNRLGLFGFPLRKTMEQERRFSAEQLVDIHRKLLEADVRIKTSALTDELVLDMLVAEMSSRPTGATAADHARQRR